MERHRFGNSDLTVSAIGLGCYGMPGVYGPADDAESIATIRRALDLGVNFLDTSARDGEGHNHRLIGEAIRGRRHDVVIHSKSGSPRDGGAEAVRGGGDPRYLRQTCERSLKNLGIETLDVFCMSRVDPNVPIEESGAVAELVKEGKARFISLSESSAESLKRGSAVHPLVSLQMEYSLFSRDAEEQGQIDACKELGIAMMAYAVLGRGMLSALVPKVEELEADDVRRTLPRFQNVNIEKNLGLRSALEAIAHRKNATLAQLSIAWPMAQGKRGQVESVWRYPVKSMRGEAMIEIFAGFSGVYGDRLYAFKSSAAPVGFPYFTGREKHETLLYRPRFRHPERATLPPNLAEAEALSPILNPIGADPADLALDVETPWGEVLAIDDPALLRQLAGGNGNGHSLTLLRSERSMTDCRPISLFSLQTARQLGEEVGAVLDKRRFRANVYLDLGTANGFSENGLVGRKVQIGSKVVVSVLERDPRCQMITLDPDTATPNPVILRKVAQGHDGTAGVYGAVLAEGIIRPGDPVAILD